MFGSDFLFTLSIRNNKTLTFKNKSVLTQKRADSNLNVETDSSSCILKLHFFPKGYSISNHTNNRPKAHPFM